MTDTEDMESSQNNNDGIATANAIANNRSGNTTNNNNNNNEESLGEIWFDTMRRSRGQGSGGNSTPSSPTNSSEQDQDQDQDQEQENEHTSNSGSDSNCSRAEDNEHINDGDNDGEAEQEQEATTQASTQKRGYQSDDEGFNYDNDNDNPNTTSDEGSAYLDAIRLMDLHKKAQQLERQERQSQNHPLPSKERDKPKPTHTHDEPELQLPAKKKQKTRKQSSTANSKQQQQHPPKQQPQQKPDAKPTASPNGDIVKVQQRLERNAREKERSGKITDQFNSLKQILQEAGVVVPKGTKGSILTIAYHFIVNMQHQQRQKQQDNAALKQQIDNIARGSLGTQTAQALHMAAKNNGLLETADTAKNTIALAMPPNNANHFHPSPQTPSPAAFDPLTVVQEKDYRTVWDSSPVAIAIATMGGTFLDCNQVFQKLLNCNKQQLRAISIFHLLQPNSTTPAHHSKSNLQLAFEKISQLLECIQNPNAPPQSSPIVLPGSIQGHDHLAIGVSLVRCATRPDANGDAHHLCVTLLRNTDASNNIHTNDSNFMEPSFVPPATLDPIPSISKANLLSQQMQILQQQQQQQQPNLLYPQTTTNALQAPMYSQQQHALTTILTKAHPLPTTASSSLSSSGSSETNNNNTTNTNATNLQDKQQQQQQLAAGESDSSRYYTIG